MQIIDQNGVPNTANRDWVCGGLTDRHSGIDHKYENKI